MGVLAPEVLTARLVREGDGGAYEMEKEEGTIEGEYLDDLTAKT